MRSLCRRIGNRFPLWCRRTGATSRCASCWPGLPANPATREDGDRPLLGLTVPNGSIIFRETIADAKTDPTNGYIVSEDELWHVSGIHEIEHQLGIPYTAEGHTLATGTIMNYAATHQFSFTDLVFGPLGFKSIVTNVRPGGPHN
ncbi:MAG: hypothetical protein SFU86_07985 [Pirellulaceae bacterium]|nr:hypothetical protein [Pirellulaceae bacterium]